VAQARNAKGPSLAAYIKRVSRAATR